MPENTEPEDTEPKGTVAEDAEVQEAPAAPNGDAATPAPAVDPTPPPPPASADSTATPPPPPPPPPAAAAPSPASASAPPPPPAPAGTPAPPPPPPASGYAPAAPAPAHPTFANGKPAVDETGEPVSPKSRLAATLLAWFVGWLGVHRFYVGKVGTGVLMILTLGGFGIWVIVDLIMILVGSFRDKEGLKLYNW